MAELDIPPGPRELFQAIHGPLARAFGGEENIRFGGGTALAARWAHRRSVDVDLFVEADPYRHFHWNTGGRFILDLTASESVERIAIGRDGAAITLHGRPGHVSIAPARGLPHDPRSTDSVLPIHNWRRTLPASSANSSNANSTDDQDRVTTVDTPFTLPAEPASS